MENLDRTFQNTILHELAAVFPDQIDLRRTHKLEAGKLPFNLGYLEQHGLVENVWSRTMSGPATVLSSTITAAGIDFISADGGLSAVLGVVTVKLHEDTLKQLLISKVQASNASPDAKARLVDKIKALPAEALGKVAEKALETGLGQVPDLVGTLQKWLGL